MDIDKIKELVKQVKTKKDLILALGLKNYPKNYYKITNVLKEHNIDITHFDGGLSKRTKYIIIEKICPFCKKVFLTKEGKKENKTCSYACSNKLFRSGKNNGNYKDINEYTDKKNRQLSKKYRKLCFEYHEHKCVICDERKILDVHHYDNNKFNNDVTNLVPICPTHHNYYHSVYKDEVASKIDEYVNNFKNKKI